MLPTHPHILTARAKPALSPWREVAAGCLAPMRFTRRALPSSQQASSPDRGLDAINLLLAGSGSVYSVFVPVYLTHRGWTQAQIGLALTVNMIAAMVCQVPAGLIMDFLERHRRQTLAVSVIGMGLVAMLLAVAPRWLPTLLAMLLLAAASSFLVPAVNAISLAVAGQAGFSERLGRNSRFGSIGAACGALVMGLCINSGFEAGLLFTAAALTFPSLWAVRAIGPDRVHLSRHGIRNPDEAGPARDGGWHALLRDRRLLVFSVSIALFAVASAGVLQVAAVETNARLGTRSGLVIAAFLILPQIVVAVVSPSIARSAENQGRRPVLLAGFATLPLRGALFALLQSSYALILVQTLEGFGGAVFGVMLSLVAADLTRPTGYYNLCLSILGLAAGLGTTLSAMMVGFTFDRFGGSVALWVLAACGALAFGFVALTMPETSERASPR